MSIAKQFNHDFSKGDFKLYNSKGNEIYYEDSNGFWWEREYDSNGKEIYFEASNGFWIKREYDSNGKQIYFENNNGYINDNRPKITELTLQEVADKIGVKVENLKIKE